MLGSAEDKSKETKRRRLSQLGAAALLSWLVSDIRDGGKGLLEQMVAVITTRHGACVVAPLQGQA